MPWGLKQYLQTGDLHFITFNCYHRAPLHADTNTVIWCSRGLARPKAAFYSLGCPVQASRLGRVFVGSSNRERSTTTLFLASVHLTLTRASMNSHERAQSFSIPSPPTFTCSKLGISFAARSLSS
jgi:hypothetical protein